MSDLPARTPLSGHVLPARGAEAAPGAETVPPIILTACALALLAALIHVQAALDHLDEYLPYGIAFILLAAGQAAWAVATYRSAARRLLRAGIGAGAIVVLVWLLSRTTGLPIGPAAGDPEPVGLLDVVATLDELAVMALAGVALRAPDGACGPSRGAGARGLMAAALGLVVLSTLVLAGGLHAH